MTASEEAGRCHESHEGLDIEWEVWLNNECFKNGAPGVTRTRGTQIRNLVLYPPELRGQRSDFNMLQGGWLWWKGNL